MSELALSKSKSSSFFGKSKSSKEEKELEKKVQKKKLEEAQIIAERLAKARLEEALTPTVNDQNTVAVTIGEGMAFIQTVRHDTYSLRPHHSDR
jgi:hypothetical protein